MKVLGSHGRVYSPTKTDSTFFTNRNASTPFGASCQARFCMSSAASFRKQSFKGEMMIFSWEKRDGIGRIHHRTHGYVVFLTMVSSKSCRSSKILASLAGPLNEATLKAMKRAICLSIALDKSADILLVIGRLLLPEGLYDCILGLEMDVGPPNDRH